MQNNLPELRRARGESQEELAKTVGVSRQTIIFIEKGRYAPSLSLAFRLASHYGKGIEEIFSP